MRYAVVGCLCDVSFIHLGKGRDVGGITADVEMFDLRNCGYT